MADQTLQLSERQLEQLAQILLGAAWADDQLHGLETRAINEILEGLVDRGKIPAVVADHFVSFDRDNFSVESAVEKLGVDDPDERRAVLSLVARVTDADFTHDFAEGDYIRRLAEAMGASEDEYRDLIVREVKLVKLPKIGGS